MAAQWVEWLNSLSSRPDWGGFFLHCNLPCHYSPPSNRLKSTLRGKYLRASASGEWWVGAEEQFTKDLDLALKLDSILHAMELCRVHNLKGMELVLVFESRGGSSRDCLASLRVLSPVFLFTSRNELRISLESPALLWSVFSWLLSCSAMDRSYRFSNLPYKSITLTLRTPQTETVARAAETLSLAEL